MRVADPALAGALECASNGLAVFPVWGVKDGACRCPKKQRCESPGKHPLMTGWQKAATARFDVIKGWAETYRGCNFGLPCGERTNLYVIECDGYQGGRLRDIPTRPTVLSFSGRGIHCFYRANGALHGADKKFGPGLGLRGEGHFVVAPGSLHANGRRYGRHRFGWERFANRPELVFDEESHNGQAAILASPLPDTLPEGQRRTALLSLAGSMRRRGSTGEAIYAALVVENNSRCVPPLDDGEVRAIAFDVAGRYQPDRALEDGLLASLEDDELYDEFQDEPKSPLGPALPPEGWLLDFVDYVSAGSMVAPEFALAVGLAELAFVQQRHVGFKLGLSHWGVNLWFVLVAAAGKKKSAALQPLNILRHVEPAGEIAGIVPVERLADLFQERRDRFTVHSEHSQLMDELEKGYMAGVQAVLNHGWDGNHPRIPVRSNRSTKDIYIERPTLTVVGATTLSDFASWAATESILRGHLTRYLFVIQDSGTEYIGLIGSEQGFPPTVFRNLCDGLERLRRLSTSIPVIGMDPVRSAKFSPEAGALLDAYDQKWTERADLPHALEGFAQRIGSQTIRLAVAYALGRSSNAVEEEDARRAVAFSEYIRTRSWRLIEKYFASDTWQAKNVARIQRHLDALEKQAGAERWVNRRLLAKKANMYGHSFEEVLDFLVNETQQWEQRDVKPHTGRPASYVRRRLGGSQ